MWAAPCQTGAVGTLLTAGGLALAFSLFLTPLFVRLFKRLELGQFVRDDGPKLHHTKRGTPSMGGIVILLATLFGFFVSAIVNGGEGISASSLLVLFMFIGMAGVGFVDDFLKVHHQRSLGLGGWAKIAGQTVVASAFGLLALQVPTTGGHAPASMAISAFRDIPALDLARIATAVPAVGVIAYLIWINFLATATTNGVNLADGLDGLATGASILAVGSYMLIGFWQFNQSCFSPTINPDDLDKCYTTNDPLSLAIVAAAICGALIGFLWWNTSPAKIIMGDTGSLGLGGALCALAIETHTELLLILIGGLFVIEAGSVIIQRAYFKATHGKRIFPMTPIHHSFELMGWGEVTIVVRFWIIAGVLIAVGVGTFYFEWLS
ncbi:Phospho-N-acetylmuramoyl-pentapeptide-transferase [Cryobacterium psychrotolerans]|uniref:Phospho-N-acetylmuramoyl-pentapeptide-transferase n=1 Tax=Cryobacterium psychrotolerans TaxID=386301 RepID=A0A1G9BDY8_9MICO|nr:Phospho-N-acetylmuramoyl-pentapeptide-transferase [Cryobacterium psychrotolerans]